MYEEPRKREGGAKPSETSDTSADEKQVDHEQD